MSTTQPSQPTTQPSQPTTQPPKIDKNCFTKWRFHESNSEEEYDSELSQLSQIYHRYFSKPSMDFPLWQRLIKKYEFSVDRNCYLNADLRKDKTHLEVIVNYGYDDEDMYDCLPYGVFVSTNNRFWKLPLISPFEQELEALLDQIMAS